MDLMIILQLIVFLGAIFIGIRLGGIAIGYAGGLGVVVLGLVLGMKPGNIPCYLNHCCGNCSDFCYAASWWLGLYG